MPQICVHTLRLLPALPQGVALPRLHVGNLGRAGWAWCSGPSSPPTSEGGVPWEVLAPVLRAACPRPRPLANAADGGASPGDPARRRLSPATVAPFPWGLCPAFSPSSCVHTLTSCPHSYLVLTVEVSTGTRTARVAGHQAASAFPVLRVAASFGGVSEPTPDNCARPSLHGGGAVPWTRTPLRAQG